MNRPRRFSRSRKHTFTIVFIFFIIVSSIFVWFENKSFAYPPTAINASPYPSSQVITGITWDFDTLVRAAPGSDLWPVTWADNNHLYTSWGDGGGFGGSNSNGRVSMGVARIEGGGANWQGYNVWGGYNPESSQTPITGKSNGGIIAIDGALYLYVQEQYTWNRAKLWKSTDHGLNWTDLGWILDEPSGAFSDPGILQFGRDYLGARDNYVYGYSERGFNNGLGLFRVNKTRLANRRAYRFFAGLDSNNDPIWSANIANRQPVFTDSNGVGWGANVVYHPILNRYLLTVPHDVSGGWGIFDAPEPWGPWTTVAYYTNWIDPEFKFTFVFPQKWMESDGKTMCLIFSGTGDYDSFNVIQGTLALNSSKCSECGGAVLEDKVGESDAVEFETWSDYQFLPLVANVGTPCLLE